VDKFQQPHWRGQPTSFVDLDCPSFANHADEGEDSTAAGRWSSVCVGEISPNLTSSDTISVLKDIAEVMLRAGASLTRDPIAVFIGTQMLLILYIGTRLLFILYIGTRLLFILCMT
jgi:hypothetical protein